MMEKTQWHPVALGRDVVQAPLAVTLLGQELVLWRSPEGQVQAFVDRCPHRGARLSLGRVENGHLECPYHGWQFAAGGQCVKVPAVPTFTPPPQHCVASFGVQEAYGLVWVQLQPAAAAEGAGGGQRRVEGFAAVFGEAQALGQGLRVEDFVEFEG